jgi:hypothetical protein
VKTTWSDPLPSHPEVEVHAWTKRDQFEWRVWDIWSLDAPWKAGRRTRQRKGVYVYVPPRWRAERSMKGERGLLEWDDGEVDGELGDVDDGDEVVKDGRHVSSDSDVASGDTAEVAVASSNEDSQPSDSSEASFDMLLDLGSGGLKATGRL